MTSPTPPSEPSVTILLQALQQGDEQAGDELLRKVYKDLRDLAHSHMRRMAPGQTLQPTALVNEAYLRLVDKEQQDWQGRRHFFFAASRAMHDVLVEDARKKASLKRGGDWRRAGPESLTVATEAPPEELLALSESLSKLEERSPDLARIVHLRFFVGLTEPEIAHVMGVSDRTVQRQWRLARARLFEELSEEDG